MKTTTNRAPIGSLWMGKDAEGDYITVEVLSDPIPGNELRKVVTRPEGVERHIGKNWFRRATKIADHSSWPKSTPECPYGRPHVGGPCSACTDS